MNTTSFYSSVEAKNQTEIIVNDSPGNEHVRIINSINEIGLTGKVKIIKDDLSYLRLIGGGLLALMFLFVFIMMVNSYFKAKLLYKKVKQIADKYDDIDFQIRRSSVMSDN